MQANSLSCSCRPSTLSIISALAAVLLFAFSSATTAADNQRPEVRRGGRTPYQVLDGTAQLVGRFDPNQKLRLVFGLQPPHMDEEEQFLRELGTKDSPNFGRFLSAEEWNERFSPSQQDEQAVVDWAKSQGLTVTHRYPNRLLVDVEAPVAVIEQALNVKINSYQLAGKNVFANDRDPEIPANLTEVIHSVIGLNNIEVLRPANRNMEEPEFPVYAPGPVVAIGDSWQRNGSREGLPDELQSRQEQPPSAEDLKPLLFGPRGYDPGDLYWSYGYDLTALYALGHCCNPLKNAGSSPPESSIAIATAGRQDGFDILGFQAQYPDLHLAFNADVIYIDGTPECCDGEGTMDLEWSMAWANSFGSSVNTAKIWMYDGANNSIQTFTDIYNQILTDGHARVLSTSWGCEEFYGCRQSDMDTRHVIFNSMIGQGWTLIAASGDAGADDACLGRNLVDFPASDPNVVAAGGTTLRIRLEPVGSTTEVGWTGGPDGCYRNDGGSGGGFSRYYDAPDWQKPLGLGSGSRAVPDIALNADWYYTPQAFYFNGVLTGKGGTSIVAPELAGFFAQANAYLDYVGSITGGCVNGSPCAPIGNGNWYIYYFGEHPSYAPHYPFYDITKGCNNNDITDLYGLKYYCAGVGYDQVTGWGSANMFQLAWAINFYRAGDLGAPVASFSGPPTGQWYNSDQTVSWTLADTSKNGLPATGVAGFSQAWDKDPGDDFSAPHQGWGSSFFSGPQFPNLTNGSLRLADTGSQGWHTVHIRAWDNTGVGSDDITYGPLGYDTTSPQTTATLSGALQPGGVYYLSPVTVSLSGTDNLSGISGSQYQVDGGAWTRYSTPFTVSTNGFHLVAFYSTDKAGNSESTKTVSFTIKAKTTTTLTSSSNPSKLLQSVTFAATITAAFGGPPDGTVKFKDGATVLWTSTVDPTTGQALYSTSQLGVGTHSITAVYGGSGGFLGSTSPVLHQVVNQ